jgi:hypothetical protein
MARSVMAAMLRVPFIELNDASALTEVSEDAG